MHFRERLERTFLCRHILWSLVLKELKAKYTGSILGIWWAIVTPFIIMGAITFVFTKVIRIDIENFPLFSLAGILPWFFFSLSLSESVSSVIQKSQLLRQFVFPLEFIPISSILSNFINFIFGLIFIIPLFVIFKIKIIFFIFLLPVVLFLHLLFTLGVGMLLSCGNVFYRDISHLLGVILMFWFWVTPIFYSIDMVPSSYRWICNVNPMTTYIMLYRDILFIGRFPELLLFLKGFIISIVTLLLGYVVFIMNDISFAKRV